MLTASITFNDFYQYKCKHLLHVLYDNFTTKIRNKYAVNLLQYTVQLYQE